MNPKSVLILVIYMILVYTTVHAFTAVAYNEGDNFVGGDHQDLFDTGNNISGVITLPVDYDDLNRSETYDWFNATHGLSEEVFIWNWLDTGTYLVFADGTEISTGDFEKILAGTYDASDMEWWDAIGTFFNSVVNAFSYIIGFLTFNIVGSTLSDGSTVPALMMWLPALMVLGPWIMIIYWILPHAIKLIHAIAEIIPL